MTIIQKLSMKLAVSLALLASASAADTSGKILGTVKDPAGNVIPQAAVSLANKSTGVKQTTRTDAQGAFTFPVIPAAFRYAPTVSRRMCAARSIRRSDHPRRPKTITCCRFSSFKTLLTLTEGTPLASDSTSRMVAYR
jgi:hypothetical protein